MTYLAYIKVNYRLLIAGIFRAICSRCFMINGTVCILLSVGMPVLGQAYFRTENAFPVLPVLTEFPTPVLAGSLYDNKYDNKIYWFNGTQWMTFASIEINDLVPTLVSVSGRIWMDRNLGASRAATSSTDYLSYGSLFQWCRAADGHEQVVWASSVSGSAATGKTDALSYSTTVTHSNFIYNDVYPYNWLSTPIKDGRLWWNGTEVGVNNPCPTGFHVPTAAEWSAEIAAGVNSAQTAMNYLRLPLPGSRASSDGKFDFAANTGFYWSSTGDNINATTFIIRANLGQLTNDHAASNAFSVRCVKD